MRRVALVYCTNQLLYISFEHNNLLSSLYIRRTQTFSLFFSVFSYVIPLILPAE